MESFEAKVDPDGTMDPVERAKRAESARKEHFARMALLSAKARRAKRKSADQRDVLTNGRQEAS
jgi:hypothetical protein